ncbi:MAG: response regulator [Phycisphaerae bacterium]|jgi:PAS domain S-box-containing protein|nr:response regulator [Phycisphaerae bacterium]
MTRFVGAIDVVTATACLAAVVILAKYWRHRLQKDVKVALSMLLVVMTFHYGSNALEWCGITDALDPIEDYVEILEPVLWGGFFYIFLRGVAERSLRASEERYRTLVDNLPQKIFLKDTNSVFVSCNKNFAADLSINAEDIAGKRDHDYYPAELADKYVADDARIMAGGQTTELEEQNVAHGQVHTVHVVKTPVKDRDGKVVGILGIFWDITDRKRAEEERKAFDAQVQHAQKLESLGVLAGGIAHDFNNLLLAILGNADLALMDMAPQASARHNVDEIKKASQRAAELSRQMLAYSGKGRFVVKAFDLSAMIEEMTPMLNVSISKKASLKYNFSKGLPEIEGDATQIRQVIMNLVTNASEAIGDRSGDISISTGTMDADRAYLQETYLDEGLPEGSYVTLEVADAGCGMSEATRARLFDPFFTTKFTGRGLGMAAVLGIIRGHRGAIRICSEFGEGTTVTVLFPAIRSKTIAPAEDPQGDAGQVDEAWKCSATVLLVDDEDSVLAIGRRILQRMGLTVLTACDGREGLVVFREHQDDIACIILDMIMPQMDGEETFDKLRRISSDVPVIMSSGYDEERITRRFAGKDLAGFIQKPYEFKELRNTMHSVLGG